MKSVVACSGFFCDEITAASCPGVWVEHGHGFVYFRKDTLNPKRGEGHIERLTPADHHDPRTSSKSEEYDPCLTDIATEWDAQNLATIKTAAA